MSAKSLSPPWYSFWVANSLIKLDMVFDVGGVNLEKPGAGHDPGVIRLIPRSGNEGELVGFTISAQNNELKPALDGLTLAPRGKDPFDLKGATLPRFSSETAVKLKYQQALGLVTEQLRQPTNTLKRLEGLFPVTGEKNGAKTFNVDRIQILNIERIVEGQFDLVFVLLTLLEIDGVAAQQNGGGSGPPGHP